MKQMFLWPYISTRVSLIKKKSFYNSTKVFSGYNIKEKFEATKFEHVLKIEHSQSFITNLIKKLKNVILTEKKKIANYKPQCSPISLEGLVEKPECSEQMWTTLLPSFTQSRRYFPAMWNYQPVLDQFRTPYRHPETRLTTTAVIRHYSSSSLHVHQAFFNWQNNLLLFQAREKNWLKQ